MEITTTKNDQKIAENFGYSTAEVAVIKKSVAKDTTDMELAYFISVCKSVGLNPFLKEIWCYKDKAGNLIVFAGRDGFLTKAQQNPLFNGIRSSEIRENDKWEIDIPNGKVTHIITSVGASRGKILGGYAFVFRKNGEPTIEFVEFEAYNKGYNAWKTHPASMIKKVAETSALKKGMGISGIQSEYEFDIKDSVAVPIETEIVLTNDVKSEIEKFTSSDKLIEWANGHELQSNTEFKTLIENKLSNLVK